MSTTVFKQFLAQLEAKDYAKAQGFDLNWYEQMSPEEIQKAEQLLLAQARTGDMSPVPSLAKIATPEAIGFLKKIFEEQECIHESILNYELAKHLWDVTGEEKYLRVFDNFELSLKTDKLIFIKLLSTLPDSRKRISQLISTFSNDSYRVARFWAAVEVLRLIGKIKSDDSNLEDYRPLLNKVASEDLKQREDGQKELSVLVNP
ncbi:MAG TPA: hypothetical protein VF690_03680 [Hymenobacter sp.]|jgi:hypothetical protein